jgi:glutamate racemase
MSPEALVVEQACPLLVPLVEEGMVNDPITELVARRYLTAIQKESISTVILGCTHYPVIREDLKKVLGPSVSLVESGDVLALELLSLFDSQVIEKASGSRQIRVCITDLTDHFERLAEQLMAPDKITQLEKVVL